MTSKRLHLKEMSAFKQPGGKGQIEKDKQSVSQKKRTPTTSQAAQTQPTLLASDVPFVATLEDVPVDDWCRTWVAGSTIMMSRTSKRDKEVVDKMCLSAVVRLTRSFWDDTRNGTDKKTKRQFVLRQLEAMTVWYLIPTLELPECEIKGKDTEILAGVRTPAFFCVCRETCRSTGTVSRAGAPQCQWQ